jgi:hypothetical protein
MNVSSTRAPVLVLLHAERHVVLNSKFNVVATLVLVKEEVVLFVTAADPPILLLVIVANDLAIKRRLAGLRGLGFDLALARRLALQINVRAKRLVGFSGVGEWVEDGTRQLRRLGGAQIDFLFLQLRRRSGREGRLAASGGRERAREVRLAAAAAILDDVLEQTDALDAVFRVVFQLPNSFFALVGVVFNHTHALCLRIMSRDLPRRAEVRFISSAVPVKRPNNREAWFYEKTKS